MAVRRNMHVFFMMLGAYLVGHIYIFLCLIRAFGSGVWLFLPGVWLAAMAFLLLARFAGAFRFARDISGPAQQTLFVWMALALFLMLCFAASDIVLLGAKTVAAFGPALPSWFTPPHLLRLALAAAVLLFCWSLHEARSPRVTRLSLVTPKLAAGMPSLRIAAVSDVHISPLAGTAMLKRMARAVGREQPDIFISLGDMVDMDLSGKPERPVNAAVIRDIPARLGKFAVTGNHEAYQGKEMSLAFMQEAGFQVLRGETAEAGGIRIAGVDDPAFARSFSDGTDSVPRVLRDTGDKFILLLVHQPVIPREAVGRFDLALSGHTHGGQIWPGKYLTRSIYGVRQGLTVLARDGRESRLFLSNGFGFWGPPVRFLTPPELVVIDISPAEAGKPESFRNGG